MNKTKTDRSRKETKNSPQIASFGDIKKERKDGGRITLLVPYIAFN
jgi:hypothetical protein